YSKRIHGQHQQCSERKKSENRSTGKKSGDHQRVHWQPRRTTHQRGDHDRSKTITTTFDRSSRHDAGYRAGKAAHQRQKSLSVKPYTAHQFVEKECRTREISRVLKDGDKKKQQQDLRKKNQDSANAGNDAIGEKVSQDTGRQLGLHEITQCSKSSVEQI